MTQWVRGGCLVLIAGWWLTRGAVADDADAVLASIRVPAGFTVERVAAAPLVQHPIMAGFDDRGRLYVADNAGLNLPAEELLKQLPNAIRMLDDTDGDGRFDRSTVFADKMTFPQGAAWFRGALYVASPPAIWRLEDTDGDGVADRRQELVQKFGFVGNAADIHGCFITPTGRIAWCDGRHGHDFAGADGQPGSKGLAARVFSCRPDGSQVEVFCGGGMDNPVEVAFTAAGDTIGTMTFYNPDDARHDALMHFVYGGVYPKKHPCTSEFKRTGELLPALSRLGVTAPSGLARRASPAWGEEYRDNLFSAQFNTHKVLRHVLSPQGATFSSVDEDFLASTHADFHPTDVLEDADGSLLVIDTGGWFRIGCPTSQIAKPEVGGAIYRIRRTDAKPVVDPRGLKIDWAGTSDTEMADLLADPRPAVAERAIELLVSRGDAAIGSLATALFESTDYRARQNGVWCLARIGTDNALRLLRQALADDDAPVRQAAAHAVSDLRDPESLPPLVDLLGHDEPSVRREVAAGLGRLRNPTAVGPLLSALANPIDRFEEHAVIYALIEINDRAATLPGLTHPLPSVRRGALIALDQMDDGRLSAADVHQLLRTDDTALLRAVVDVLSRHPDWADALAGVIATWLELKSPTLEQLATAQGAVAALGARPAVQQLVASALAGGATCRETRLMLLEVLATGENGAPPAVWTDALRHNLTSSDEDVLRQTILTTTALGPQPFARRLMEIGLDGARSVPLRIAALSAAAKGHPQLSSPGFIFLAEQLTKQESLRDRLSAAEALGGCDLTAEQLLAMSRLVANCGPLEVSWLLHGFDRDTSVATGLSLVGSLAKSPALASLSGQRLRELFAHYPGEVQAAAKKLLENATPDDRQRSEKLQSLAAAVEGGDAARGEEVFFGSRAACSACHRLGTRGERIGPDLSKIGEVRNRRDLLEAVVFPSASLARGYESFSLVTKDGKIVAGLLSRETAAAVVLRTIDRSEVRIPRDEIEALTPSITSIMPQGLEKTLSERELADLIAFLVSCK